MKIITRKEAMAQGLKRYFTGKACKRGHVAERSISGACVECSSERSLRLNPHIELFRFRRSKDTVSREFSKRSGESLYYSVTPCKYGHIGLRMVANTACDLCYKTIQKKSRDKHSKKRNAASVERRKIFHCEILEREQKWRDKNRESINERTKKWRDENKEHLIEYKKRHHQENRDRMKKYREDNIDEVRRKSREYYAENRESILKKKRDYWDRDKEGLNAKRKDRRDSDKEYKEKVRLQGERSKLKHREKILASQRARYKNNKSAISKRRKELWEANPNYAINGLIAANRRRANKRHLTPPRNYQDRHTITKLYKNARELSALTGRKFHIDHIWPLHLGGVHHPCNLQILEATTNLRKHASHDGVSGVSYEDFMLAVSAYA